MFSKTDLLAACTVYVPASADLFTVGYF